MFLHVITQARYISWHSRKKTLQSLSAGYESFQDREKTVVRTDRLDFLRADGMRLATQGLFQILVHERMPSIAKTLVRLLKSG